MKNIRQIPTEGQSTEIPNHFSTELPGSSKTKSGKWSRPEGTGTKCSVGSWDRKRPKREPSRTPASNDSGLGHQQCLGLGYTGVAGLSLQLLFKYVTIITFFKVYF